MVRLFAVGLFLILGILRPVLAAGKIETKVYPVYADGRDIDTGTPFAVYVEISSWTAAADSQVNVMVTTVGGKHFLIWNDPDWKNAHQYANCPVRTIDSNGNWSGLIYLRAKDASRAFRSHARDVDDTGIIIHEAIADTNSVTYMDMSTTGAWVYATAASSAEGKAVLAFNASDEIIGTYAIEDNGVTEGYTTTSGYFKMAIPASTSIPKLQARNADNSVYNTQTSSNWQSGSAGSTTNLDYQEDVSLPVELTNFTATPGNAKVTLNWTTESEVENLGFNIYKSLYSNEQFTIINDQLIPGHGNTSSRHEYQYIDRNVINGIEYWYQLEDVSHAGETEKHNIVSTIPKGRVELGMIPNDFQLFPCYPNPFNPTTNISFNIPENSHVTLRIIDLRGNLVITLIDRELQQNQYEVTWNGKDAKNRIVGNGIYFYQLTTNKGFKSTGKMVFLR